MSASPTDCLAVALECAARGWHVFPCGPDKKPLAEHGFKDATTDADRVTAFWTTHPQASIGVATGASGLVVVDNDCKNGAPGLDNWHELVAEHGAALEATTLVETPSGGMHVYYQANGHKVACSTSKVAEGIDVRAEGGYVIAGGSPGYLYVDDHGPEKIAPLPQALGNKLAHVMTKPSREKPAGRKILEGSRDATLTSLAGSMRRVGFSPEAIHAALAEENKARCTPPLPDRQVRKIAGSVGRYEPSDPLPAQEEPEAKPKIKWLTGRELAALTPEEPDYVLAPYLARGLIVQLTGKVKGGKTTLAMHMGAAVLHSRAFLDES